MAAGRLTVAIITKNEAENLEACLNAVDWADEIVIVDSGSTDGTLGIGRRFTDKVFVEPDWPGFGLQRQRAQDRASGDWILALDADERVTPALRENIQRVLQEDDRTKVYALSRLSWFLGRFIRHSGWYPDFVLRLYPRERARYNSALVHEKLVFGPEMSVIRLQGDLHHYTFKNLEHWVIKTAQYATAWGEQRYRLGRRGNLLSSVTHAAGFFLKTYFLRRGFLDGPQGFILAVLGAYSKFLKYADLWSRSRLSGGKSR